MMIEDEETKRWAFPRLRHNEYFIDHSCDVSRAFGGDLQQALVLAVIGQATLRFYAPVGRPKASSPWLGASRVADVTGIPRETVRRKLLLLAEKGWIEQDGESGAWRMVFDAGLGPAKRDLADVESRGMENALRFARAIRDLL